MEVPLRLTRRPTAATVDACLLLTDGFDRLSAIGQATRSLAFPTVHPVRGGFVLLFSSGTVPAIPGTVRLRRVSGELYTLADADLVPRFLPDEVVALTRDRGLVVLPGGVVLAFDPACPLSMHDWLSPGVVRRAEWQPFPSLPARVDRLVTVERPAGPAAVIEILSAGQPDDARPLPGPGESGSENIPEDARPQSGSPLGRLAAGTQLAAGRLLVWIGGALGATGLAKKGADLARHALEQVPRLSERVLGAQEAALREVLRQIRSGDVEKALRRAPIAVPDPNTPSRIGTGADLGYRNPLFSLRDLLYSGSGPGEAWLGGGDVWTRLAEEYRRLAREATAQGDYRRAAYLHGVLLRDLRGAVNVLMAGGYYRDAAILLRDRLHDPSGAAAAFEKAAEYDESIRLYDQQKQYEPAGDLLRRIGEEDRAQEYYYRAASHLYERGRTLAAGDLVQRQLGDTAGAAHYYTLGWKADQADSLSCAERLLDQYVLKEAWEDVEHLLEVAETRFAPPRSRDAGRFFNYLLSLGPEFLASERRDEYTDRARLFLAHHIRSQSGTPRVAEKLVAGLFGGSTHWPPPVIRDATAAVRKPGRLPVLTAGSEPPVRLTDGTVTCVVCAQDSGDLIVASTSSIICWRADSGLILPVLAVGERSVLGLAVDPAGRMVHVLYQEDDQIILRCLTSSGPGPFTSQGQVLLAHSQEEQESLFIQPTAECSDDVLVTVAAGARRTSYRSIHLLPETPRQFLNECGGSTYLLVTTKDCAWDWDGRFLRCVSGSSAVGRWVTAWTPSVAPWSSLTTARVDWLTPEPRVLEVTGIDADGNLYWSEFVGRGSDRHAWTASLSHPDRFSAACFLAPRTVAVVTGRNQVQRLRVSGSQFHSIGIPVTVRVPARVVYLVRRTGQEFLGITEDGGLVRIPVGG